MAYLLKSICCLGLFYGFYYLILRKQKTYVFNRFFLLFSMTFSMVAPLFKIHINSPLPLNLDSLLFSSTANQPVQQVISTGGQPTEVVVVNPILVVYLLVATVLILRFAFNLVRLLRLVKMSIKITQYNRTLVLVEAQTLPYSFFNYVFINAKDYKNGNIEAELLQHEQAHVDQGHSLDVLFVELTRIVFWFNPMIWLLGKAIRLNHEYLADEAVLRNREISSYQNLLLNVVFRNHSTYLASSFAYSCTKNRLIMMQKKSSGSDSLRKLLTIPLTAFLGLLVVQAQTPAKTPVQTDKKVVKTTVKYKKPTITQTPDAKKTVKFAKPVLTNSSAVRTTVKYAKPKIKKTIKFTPPVMEEEKPKASVQVDVKDVPPPPPPAQVTGTATTVGISDVPPTPIVVEKKP